MSTISPAELVTLRTKHPHSGKFYLSILSPTVVYCGKISIAIVRGATQITLSNISGDIANVVEGNTIYVGMACGDYSVSIRRYRSRVGNVITVDENSVVWDVSHYITILDNHEVFPIYPFISDTTPFVFYKDKDIVYSDQNTYPPPVAIAGAPKVGFLTAGMITFDLDASDSYVIASGATITTYHWECSSGSIANSNIAVTTISFTVAGQYWLKLTVTDSNNKSQITYRRIYVHERSGVNAPCLDFEITSNPNGSYDSGWSMRVKLLKGAELTNISDGTQVVLWYESYYDGVEQYIGDAGNVRLVGYIRSETVNRQLSLGYVEFEVATIDAVLDACNMFSISLEENAIVDTWYKFPTTTLTVARAIHHLWKWHSTLFEVCDVFLPVINTNTMSACDDMENGTLLTLTSWAYSNGIYAKTCCDKLGRMHVEEDLLLVSLTRQAAVPVVLDILAVDRRGESDVQYVRNGEAKTASVLASGVAYIGGLYTPIMSLAPGNVPNNRGKNTVVAERLCLATQAQLNELCGRLLSMENREFIEIRLSFAGNYPVDVIAQEWFTITLPTDARGVTFDNIRMVCRSVTDVIDMMNGTVYSECSFELMVKSVSGTTEPIVDPIDEPPAPPVVYPETPLPPYDPPPPYYPPYYPPYTPPYTPPGSGNLFGFSTYIGFSNAVLSLGIQGYTEIPFNCVIYKWVLLSAITGSVVVDIWKVPYISFPPTSLNSITGSAKPTLLNAYKSYGSGTLLVGWNKTLLKGDILGFSVISVSLVKRVTLSITGTRL